MNRRNFLGALGGAVTGLLLPFKAKASHEQWVNLTGPTFVSVEWPAYDLEFEFKVVTPNEIRVLKGMKPYRWHEIPESGFMPGALTLERVIKK